MKRPKLQSRISNPEAYMLNGRKYWRKVSVIQGYSDGRFKVQYESGTCHTVAREGLYANLDQVKAAIERTKEIHKLVKALYKGADSRFTMLERWVAVPLPEERETQP